VAIDQDATPAGVHVFFGSGAGVKNFEKPDPDPDSLFIFDSIRNLRSLNEKVKYLGKMYFWLHRLFPEFEQKWMLEFEKLRSRIRIQKF